MGARKDIMKPLTKNQITQWEESLAVTSALESVIEDRIGYVIKVWVEAFGGKLTNWYFYGAGENEVGDLKDHMWTDSVHSLHIECNPNIKCNDRHDMVILTKDGGEWAWDSSIPIRWLFEDCEEEIVKGKALYEEKLKKKTEDAAIKKSLKKKLDSALAEKAKAKLTPEELRALKKVL
jgi:hypothetical protein